MSKMGDLRTRLRPYMGEACSWNSPNKRDSSPEWSWTLVPNSAPKSNIETIAVRMAAQAGLFRQWRSSVDEEGPFLSVSVLLNEMSPELTQRNQGCGQAHAGKDVNTERVSNRLVNIEWREVGHGGRERGKVTEMTEDGFIR